MAIVHPCRQDYLVDEMENSGGVELPWGNESAFSAALPKLGVVSECKQGGFPVEQIQSFVCGEHRPVYPYPLPREKGNAQIPSFHSQPLCADYILP